jgi:hypothetical protein
MVLWVKIIFLNIIIFFIFPERKPLFGFLSIFGRFVFEAGRIRLSDTD